jgi:hypothetical protein
MLVKVANDDLVSFKNNNHWLTHHPNEAILFKDLENVWNELKPIYNGDFKGLVYGTLPNDNDVLKTLIRIKERLKSVEWLIVNEFLRK